MKGRLAVVYSTLGHMALRDGCPPIKHDRALTGCGNPVSAQEFPQRSGDLGCGLGLEYAEG